MRTILELKNSNKSLFLTKLRFFFIKVWDQKLKNIFSDFGKFQIEDFLTRHQKFE